MAFYFPSIIFLQFCDFSQKANAIIHHLSSQLSPDPINNLSDTSCSPITPLVEKITASK